MGRRNRDPEAARPASLALHRSEVDPLPAPHAARPARPNARRDAPRKAGVRCLLIALVAIGAPCGAGADEPAQQVIVGLEWKGVDHVSRRELARAILTRGPDWKFWKPKPPFDEFALEEDLGRIASFYREHGFFEASARTELEWNEARSEVLVRILVEEGEPTPEPPAGDDDKPEGGE